MPILHTQFRGEAKNPSGGVVQVHPQAVLAGRGPVLQVTLGLSEKIATQLVEQGKPVPTPVAGFALIDTGASGTCIDDATAKKLGLPVIDKVKMASASHDATEMNVYPALIEFVGVPIKINAERSVGANLGSQGLIVLLGRDLLQNLTIFYNGPAGELTISL